MATDLEAKVRSIIVEKLGVEESDVTRDAEHCGACGRRCHADGPEVYTSRCESGACVFSG